MPRDAKPGPEANVRHAGKVAAAQSGGPLRANGRGPRFVVLLRDDLRRPIDHSVARLRHRSDGVCKSLARRENLLGG